MPKIKFIEFNGTEHVVDGEVGQSIMQAALNNMVPGIIGDCGGYCNCATCHGYIDEAWVAKIPAPEQLELDMVSCAIDPQSNSRLTCQVHITDDMEGFTVRLPKSQT